MALLVTPIQAYAGDALLSKPEVRAALDYIKSHEHEQIEEQIAIAQVPSSPFHEQKRGEFLKQEFERVGLQHVEIDPIGNVLGWRPGTSDRALVIAAHLDTVFPEATDFTVKRLGTRLNGPGIEDDSRGLAVLIALAEALRPANIHTRRSLLFVANVGEEGLGNLRGGKYLFEQCPCRDRIDAFISVDG
ncbi:MAG: M20/M25/M40 family metallo-hydrolase, partial [Acidobacteriaceae bacterium]|nr:M20/M25/M40 family metallo-hydrolase [Acidobacteriaceae bacterium]